MFIDFVMPKILTYPSIIYLSILFILGIIQQITLLIQQFGSIIKGQMKNKIKVSNPETYRIINFKTVLKGLN